MIHAQLFQYPFNNPSPFLADDIVRRVFFRIPPLYKPHLHDEMKLRFGWKPLILWSLHLYDIYKSFLGKGCPSGQWICSRFFNTFL